MHQNYQNSDMYGGNMNYNNINQGKNNMNFYQQDNTNYTSNNLSKSNSNPTSNPNYGKSSLKLSSNSKDFVPSFGVSKEPSYSQNTQSTSTTFFGNSQPNINQNQNFYQGGTQNFNNNVSTNKMTVNT